MPRKRLSPSEKKKPKSFGDKYPILYHIGEIPIRRVNLVTIYIPEHNMAAIAKVIQNSTKMSFAKVIAFSGQPCETCKNEPVTVTLGAETFLIPRGLLSPKKQASGIMMTQKKRS